MAATNSTTISPFLAPNTVAGAPGFVGATSATTFAAIVVVGRGVLVVVDFC